MSSRSTFRSRLVAVTIGAAVIVGGANLAAYAANGKPLLLGKNNVATKTTTVNRPTGGPALKLRTRPTSPPLKVSSSTKVVKLNADKVDGLDASAFATHVRSSKCFASYGAEAGFCKTGAFTPKVPGYAVVDFSAYATGTGLFQGQAAVSTNNGATWSKLNPSWYTATNLAGDYDSIGSSAYVPVTPGHTYWFGYLASGPASSSGGGQVMATITPAGPGSTASTTGPRLVHGKQVR